MGETTLQDRRAAATRHPTNKYTALRSTALAFIATQRHNASQAAQMDLRALGSLAAPSFSHTFGPAHAVSCAPNLQGVFTVDELVAHLSGMIPRLDGWEVEVKGCVVDEVGESVVVRASYWMRVRGAREAVENDVVWWLELEERMAGSEIGEGNAVDGGWKVRKSTEMVDAAAAGRIRELMAESKGSEVGRGD